MNKNKYLHGLVFGEVGSGKSIIIMLLMLLSLQNNIKIIISTPNILLSYQHYQNFSKIFVKYKIFFYTAGTKLSKEQLNNFDIIIGTLSILNLDFPETFSLALIDEEHKYGVNIKENLWKNGISSLYFSATPIPRTIVQKIYGLKHYFELKNEVSNR